MLKQHINTNAADLSHVDSISAAFSTPSFLIFRTVSQYRANVNLMIGYFKYRLSAMLLFAGKALDICRLLILLCLKQPVPMIKGRSAPRPEFSHQRKVFCPKYSI